MAVEDSHENSLLPDICEFMAALDPEHQDILCRYLVEPPISNDENTMNIDITKEHYISQFKKILKNFQQLVSRRLLSRVPSSGGFSPNSDPVVIDATKCIAAMCKFHQFQKY